MIDVEQIKSEIERKRQEIKPLANFQTIALLDRNEFYRKCEDYGLAKGWLNALKWVEDFINSLPAEQPSEDLEESIIEFLGHVPENEPEHSETLYTYEQMQEIARHFAQWQKEQMTKNAVETKVQGRLDGRYFY